MTPTRTRAPRNTLDRATVAAAALDLMDAEGAGALTIRALAKRLGVAPMALYNHAATKEDILAAARDHGLARLPAADPGQGHWRDRVRAINLAFHRALREHPSLVGLLVARPLAGQAPIDAAEAQLRVLREAGFDPDTAARVHLVLLHYALGAAGWTAPRVAGESPRTSRAALERLPADRYPTLAALAGPLAAASHDDGQYAFGLDLLLSAVAAREPDRQLACFGE